MRNIITPILVLCLLFCLAVPAFATGEEFLDETTTVTDTGSNIYVDNDVILANGQDILTGVNTFVVNQVTPADTHGLKSALLSVLGNYDAIIVEYEYQNTANDVTTYMREIQPDYVWLCSAAILLVFIFCIFKWGVAVWKG